MTVLFILPKTVSFLRNKSCSCTTCIVYVNLFKDRFFYVGFLFRKADAKVKTFKYIFQIFSEVFFIFPFSRHLSCERKNKGKIRLPTRIQEKVSTNAAYFLKAGAKVGLYNIQAKYIRGFFRVFLKHFYKTLIDKRVEEHIFKRG